MNDGCVSYNAHSLCHLSEHAFNFGSLPDFSAYVLKIIYLQELKNMVCSPNSLLIHVMHQLKEKESLNIDSPKNDSKVSVQYSTIVSG